MKYAVTKNGIVHAVSDKDTGGYWDAICGKWISPAKVFESIPGEARLCSQCKKKLEKGRS